MRHHQVHGQPPDNANFQMDMKLNQLIQDKEVKTNVRNHVTDVMNIIQTFENARVQYRRNVGSSPDQGRLKMLVWAILDPKTKLELTRDRVYQLQSMLEGKMVENAYAHVCRTIKNRYNF